MPTPPEAGQPDATYIGRVRVRAVIAVILSVMICMIASAPVASAGSGDQPIEWSTYKGGRPTYSLTHVGLTGGCKKGAPLHNVDHKFWINLNASFDPDKFRIYSNRDTTKRAFANTAPIGYDLTTSSPYICLGIIDTAQAGGPGWTAASLFVWVS